MHLKQSRATAKQKVQLGMVGFHDKTSNVLGAHGFVYSHEQSIELNFYFKALLMTKKQSIPNDPRKVPSCIVIRHSRSCSPLGCMNDENFIVSKVV